MSQILQNYNNSWYCLDGQRESNAAEAFRTQGKARLGIEGQSLWRTRLLPKSQPREAGALIHSFLEKSEPEPARIGDLTYSAQQRGHLQKHIPKARLGGRVKVFVAFFLPSVFAAPPCLSSRSCDAMAAAFQHFGAWTAPICNPSALHPPAPTRHRLRSILLLPAPAQPALPYTINTPISTITVMISTITSAVTTVNTTVSCHLDKARGPQGRGKDLSFQAWEGKFRWKTPLKTKRDACLRERESEDRRDRPGQGDRWGTCQTPAVSQLPFSRLGTV